MFIQSRHLSYLGYFGHPKVKIKNLFAGCNPVSGCQGKWMIIFEDLEKKEILESVTEKEPKADLKQIESLFYQQNK